MKIVYDNILESDFLFEGYKNTIWRGDRAEEGVGCDKIQARSFSGQRNSQCNGARQEIQRGGKSISEAQRVSL